MATIPTNISAYVGETPLVELTRSCLRPHGAQLFAKVESFNPGGSVKDRIGLAMIEAAEREGRDRAWPHDDRRGDQRQHRDRAGIRLCRQGI